jgi:hypothetical protein
MARPSEWLRTTDAAGPDELPAAFRAAVEAHAERVGVSAPLADVRACAVTHSEPPSGGGFLRRRKRPYDTWILAAGELVVVVSDASGDPVVSLYRRAEVEVKRYDPVLIEDSGLELTGMPLGATAGSSAAFVPLGSGPAAEAIEAALRAPE